MFYVGVDVPMQRYPVANWVLIAVTVIASLFAWGNQSRAIDELDLAVTVDTAKELTPEKQAELVTKFQKALESGLSGALQPRSFRLMQLFTHAFVHGDFWHLLGNMIFLFAFGNAINAKIGHWQFLLCYLFFAAFAGLGWMILGNGMPMVGASGAIMGIAGMFFVLYPFNELAIHSPDTYIWSGDAWRMPSWIFVLIYMILDLWGTLQKGAGIAYAAHLAGEIGGAALAIGLVTAGWVTSDRGEQNLPETWGWVKEQPAPRRRRKKPKQLPPRVGI